jgi:hypothetical protein
VKSERLCHSGTETGRVQESGFRAVQEKALFGFLCASVADLLYDEKYLTFISRSGQTGPA